MLNDVPASQAAVKLTKMRQYARSGNHHRDAAFHIYSRAIPKTHWQGGD
jgi:hypothetical protein